MVYMTKIYGLYELLSLKISSFKPKKPVFEGGAGLPGGISPDLLQPRPWENFLSFFFGLPHCISRLIIFESLNFFWAVDIFSILEKLNLLSARSLKKRGTLACAFNVASHLAPRGCLGVECRACGAERVWGYFKFRAWDLGFNWSLFWVWGFGFRTPILFLARMPKRMGFRVRTMWSVGFFSAGSRAFHGCRNCFFSAARVE